MYKTSDTKLFISELPSQMEPPKRPKLDERLPENSGGCFETNKNQLTETLFNVFGYKEYRSKVQQEAIETVFDGKKDCFICMPTGAGKSLCYQLPSAADPLGSITIVISPLIALITNQISQMQKLGLNAVTINSSLSKAQQEKIKVELFRKTSKIKMLYITAEMASSVGFSYILEHLYKSKRLSRIAVDEAHCVSQWGHDFRPHYLKLGLIKERYSDVPWIALTATASPAVVEDIIKLLCLRNPVSKFRSSPFRENLYYDVVFKDLLKNPLIDLKEFAEESLMTKLPVLARESTFLNASDLLKTTKDRALKRKANGSVCVSQQSITSFLLSNSTLKKIDSVTLEKEKTKNVGIIYCRTRQCCDEIAMKLTALGFISYSYHAGLTPSQRKTIQEKWMKAEVTCICATISFGMGVDKSEVRFVAHWNLPQSLSAYYQESGRAGRDGKASRCRIYYSRKDKEDIEFLMRQEDPKLRQQSNVEKSSDAIKKFEKVVDYCENQTKCRHLLLVKEFEQLNGSMKNGCGKCCDFCENPGKVRRSLEQLKRHSNVKRYFLHNEFESFGLAKFDDVEDSKEKLAAKESDKMLSVVQKEFSKRHKKVNKTKTHQSLDSDVECIEDTHLLEPENRRIKDIDLEFRILFRKKIKDELQVHIDKVSTFSEMLNKVDFDTTSAKIELQIYKQKGSRIAYKAGVAEIIKQLKSENNDLLPLIKNILSESK